MKLETDQLQVEIEESNGALLQLTDKRSGVELISDARLGELFTFVYTDETSQANEIRSSDQEAPQISRGESSIVLTWAGPLKGPHARHNIAVEVQIDVGQGTVSWRYLVANRSDVRIDECRLVRIGGIEGYGDRGTTRLVVPVAGTSAGRDLFHDFRSASGHSQELGTPVAENLFMYPGDLPMPWADLASDDRRRGLCFSALDELPRLRCLQVTVHPGVGHLRKDTWPTEKPLDEVPRGLCLNWVAFPYLQPGGDFHSATVTLRLHDGDWHQAGAEYRQWFDKNKPLPRASVDGGIRSCGAVQDTMFLLPEGNINLRYSQMREWAADAAQNGVKAVLASGWDLGGHDSMYPYYEPDPRLGTWGDLEKGIAECHEEGVKVFFFVNLQAVDCTTDWYRTELHRFRTMDPWGMTKVMGWGMGTVAARLGSTRRPNVFVSPGFPEYRQLISKQFERLASIGADGVHIDKLAWSQIAPLDFNPDLTDPPDLAIWKGVLAFLDEVTTSCRAINPEFSLSHEGAWDEVLTYSNVCWPWYSTWDRDYEPVYKFVFPEWLPALSVTQPGDFNVVNAAVRYGCQMLIGPGNYTRSMAYPPMRALSAYIREVNAIRDQLGSTLLRGRFTDRYGANVTHGPDVRFSTHCSHDGQISCVIVNYGPSEDVVHVESVGQGPVTIMAPFKGLAVAELPMRLTVPPERMTIVTTGAAND
jgi:hypothetical protein